MRAPKPAARTGVAPRRELPSVKPLRAVFSRVSLYWGFTVRVAGASAAQAALPIVPPTTVVGSFVAALFKVLGLRDLSEAPSRAAETRRTLSKHFECALKATLAAAAGLAAGSDYVGLCVHQEPSRLVAAPYKTGGSWTRALRSPFGSAEFYSKLVPEALPVQALGAAYGPGALLDLLWVFEVETLVNCLSREVGSTVRAEHIDEVGPAAAYGVTRVGSKEGLASVELAAYVKDGISVLSTGEVVRTHLYVPAFCVEPVTRDVARIGLWDLEYEYAEYFVPEPASEALVVPVPPERVPSYRIVNNLCSAYAVPGEIKVIGVGAAYGSKSRPSA